MHLSNAPTTPKHGNRQHLMAVGATSSSCASACFLASALAKARASACSASMDACMARGGPRALPPDRGDITVFWIDSASKPWLLAMASASSAALPTACCNACMVGGRQRVRRGVRRARRGR
eukprot:CAMPEP_0198537456 /NCGR_PEP_ID=MMETSP1462-20131121/43725_1 /TAXON_ID=1333877 /ORGANISM="Brandtodinium nutriculum, Strain RCC3387" /LENGTH=120 /DNA_ID=CAMNT_0044267443 /DNA_START=222 /DNA_END=581 /DNA_ORIENTATION=+